MIRSVAERNSPRDGWMGVRGGQREGDPLEGALIPSFGNPPIRFPPSLPLHTPLWVLFGARSPARLCRVPCALLFLPSPPFLPSSPARLGRAFVAFRGALPGAPLAAFRVLLWRFCDPLLQTPPARQTPAPGVPDAPLSDRAVKRYCGRFAGSKPPSGLRGGPS